MLFPLVDKTQMPKESLQSFLEQIYYPSLHMKNNCHINFFCNKNITSAKAVTID